MATPVFLRDFVPYSEYLSMMRHPLPPYDTTSLGETVVFFGEVFCRVPGCRRNRNAFSATNNMRAHLRNCHGFRVQRTRAGNPYIYQDVSREWYQSLARPSDTQNTPDPLTSSPEYESPSPESEHQSARSEQNRSEDSRGPGNPPHGPDSQNPIFTVAMHPQDPNSQANAGGRVLIGTFQIWFQWQSQS